jgi:hypothetical protein
MMTQLFLFLWLLLLLFMLPSSPPLIASFSFPTNPPTHFDPDGISFKLTFLNHFVTLLPFLPVLLTAATTVVSSANTPMTPPFLTQPVDGGSFGIASITLLMASLILVIVSFSILLLPLVLLLTSLGLTSFPFLILPVPFSDQSPFWTLLPTLPVVLLPSAR